MPLVSALAAMSAVAAEAPPTAGTLLQQTQPVKPPTSAPANTGLKVEGDGQAGAPDSRPLHVTRIVISGNKVFDTDTLHALVAEAEGHDLTLSQLDVHVARITDYYRSHGYALTRAILPAQSVRDGVLNVQVIEARYGAIALDNHSRAGDWVLSQTLSGLHGGADVLQQDYEHTLLMMSDVPGVQVSATLKPGSEVGTTDLQVETTAAPPVTGSVVLDSYGNHATGRARLTGSVSVYEPFHVGDVASVAAVTTGEDMNYGSLSYEALAIPAGTRVGGSITALHYKLGGGLSALGGHGTAEVASLWARQTIWRQREANVFVRAQFDHQTLHDDLDATNIRTDRHLDVGSITFNGDLTDHLLAGAANAWSVSMSSGKPKFDNAQAQAADASTARTQAGFFKITLNAARSQFLDANDSLFVNFFAQRTDHNLDPSQKMVAGGPYSVRAYDVGALSGDQGELATFEFRHQMAPVLGGALQAIAFYDGEHVTVNKSPWVSSLNAATLQGVGVGLGWTTSTGWSAKAYAAAPIGATSPLAGTHRSWHGGAEINCAF